eukprot:2994552-Amphidinium_carterae.1
MSGNGCTAVSVNSLGIGSSPCFGLWQPALMPSTLSLQIESTPAFGRILDTLSSAMLTHNQQRNCACPPTNKS